jgi:hypothetical protein
MTTSSQTWKNLEKAACVELGCTHINRGNDFSIHDLDGFNDTIVLDAKLRADGWGFLSLYDKLVKDQKELYPRHIPILILKKKGRRSFFVVMDIKDFKKVVKEEVITLKGEQNE